MNKFDLFELHDSKQDIKSRGWIGLGGIKLIREIKKGLVKINFENKTVHSFSKTIAKNIGIKQQIVFLCLSKIIKEDEKFSIPIPILKEITGLAQ